MLGKPTTLMQANHGTLMWLEYHARRLLKKALELENEIMQFKPIPDIVHRMLNTRVCTCCTPTCCTQASVPMPHPLLARSSPQRVSARRLCHKASGRAGARDRAIATPRLLGKPACYGSRSVPGALCPSRPLPPRLASPPRIFGVALLTRHARALHRIYPTAASACGGS